MNPLILFQAAKMTQNALKDGHVACMMVFAEVLFIFGIK